MKQFVAIIGDIHSSRRIEERKKIQNQLTAALSLINDVFKDAIAAKFVITLGDEFQGLLCDGSAALKIILQIRCLMAPVSLRFGIGIGQITTTINHEAALGADGPAFYCARDAISAAKRSEKKRGTAQSDLIVRSQNMSSNTEKMVDSITQGMYAIHSHWTDQQRRLVVETMLSNETQSNIAKRNNVSQSAVSQLMSSNSGYAFISLTQTLGQMIGQIQSES